MRGIAIIVAALAACRSGAAEEAGPPRVVSLHDVTTDMVVALGAADRLVGVAEPVDGTPDGVAAIAGIPRVCGLESIVAAEPDVVLGLGVVEEQDPELVANLRARCAGLVLADPATIEDMLALL